MQWPAELQPRVRLLPMPEERPRVHPGVVRKLLGVILFLHDSLAAFNMYVTNRKTCDLMLFFAGVRRPRRSLNKRSTGLD